MSKIDLTTMVENELVEDGSSVWRLKNHDRFGYSDGAGSEKYLRRVFANAADLSTRSAELEAQIKDWPSEYHLTPKRAQLLSGFTFDRSLRVLEVGCGCGAITRHLGENFDQVVSIEGNINRARLARQRTRDLDSVSVICAPFQEIRFSEKFDVIFCIGVFEYSAAFIEGEDPYEAALEYFSSMLSPDGLVVIAIENQFGLKYFCSAREDHLGTVFEGLEGYHRNPKKVRTFGKVELEKMLRKHFSEIEFYYPYPDYKVPDCVVSSEFLASGRAGELVSQMRSRDYCGWTRPLWDEAATVLELARNGMLDFFSNSFLVFAGKSSRKRFSFDQLAILFSSGRRPAYTTRSRVVTAEHGGLHVEKRRLKPDAPSDQAMVLVDTSSPWVDVVSLLTLVTLRSLGRQASIREIFAPARVWSEMLLAESSQEQGVRWLDGAHVDSIWSNAYVIDGVCRIIDREWIWHERIPLSVLVIRAIYDFLSRTELSVAQSDALRSRSGKGTIRKIAEALGITLDEDDFSKFVRLESEIQWIASGKARKWTELYLRWFLADRPTRRFARKTNDGLGRLFARVSARISNLV